MSHRHHSLRSSFAPHDVTSPAQTRARRDGFPADAPGFGPGFGRGPRGSRGPRGGGRAGHGDVRAAILLLLVDQPMHGYQIIQEISERSGGAWSPSPGAVYPALNLLQDEGLVEISAEGGRRLATLTDAGRAYLAEHAEELGDPWQGAAGRGHGRRGDVREALGAVAAALHQVMQTGTEQQIDQAMRILDRARRELYLVLAGPAPEDLFAGENETGLSEPDVTR